MKVSAGRPEVGKPTLSLRKPRASEIADELKVLGQELIEAADGKKGELRLMLRGFGINVTNAARRVKLLDE